jgi:hypothetical protein
MLAYYARLAAVEPRLRVQEIGRDWSGQPLAALSIGSREPTPSRRAIVITSGTHAHELGGGQLMPELVHELLTTRQPNLNQALESIDLVIVPVVNPGGLQIVADWRERTRGQPHDGVEPPGQTHSIGHDLNRDWIMQTQPETRAVVQHVLNRWRPAIVLDLHEMPPHGPRYALPPYVEPIDPNIPSAVNQASDRLGNAIAAQMAREGKSGVATGLFFDAFSPARAYSPYHGGARVLAEAAGTRLGLPVYLSAVELASAPGFNPREASATHSYPWTGGRWSLSDVGAYHRTAAMTTIIEGARLDLEPVESLRPGAFVIPPLAMQPNPDAARRLRETLIAGDVRLEEAITAFQFAEVKLPAGTVIVDSAQPAWPWAASLLSVQHYPASQHGNPRPPYDVAAQTLPLLMGVDVIKTDQRPAVATRSLGLQRLPSPVPKSAGSVAVYCSQRPNAAEAGWAITMLTDAGNAPAKLSDAAIRSGDLDRFDIIILPHQRPDYLINGLNLADYPAEFVGGIGQIGIKRLKFWTKAGGLLIAIDGACRAVIDGIGLSIDAIDDGFYAPGSILRVELDAGHPVTGGCGAELAIMSVTSVAFGLRPDTGPDVRAIARYPLDDPLLSGWLSGWERLAGKAAIVEQRLGDGAVLLFGCRPLFRGQSLASRRMIVNAIGNARKS